MNDLLDFVLDAHGGLKRWSGDSTLTAKLAAGGPFWGQQGFPDAFLDETLTIDTRRQHAVFTPWTAPGQSLTACVWAIARDFVFDATDCVHIPSIE